MYKCTPKQLRENVGDDFFEMMQDLKCRSVEIKTQKANQALMGKK